MKADVSLSKCNAKPPFNSQIANQPRFTPNNFDENSQELQESFLSNMVQLGDGNKTMVRGILFLLLVLCKVSMNSTMDNVTLLPEQPLNNLICIITYFWNT